MESFGKFFQLIADVYTFPLSMHTSCVRDGSYITNCERDWVGTILFGTAIYGSTLLVLGLICVPVVRRIWILVKRERCQHTECDHQWTLKISDGSEPGCQAGQGCCGACEARHKHDALVRRTEDEPRISCPQGHGAMEKVISCDLIIDECKECGSVFLDGGELAKALRRSHRDEYSADHLFGYNTGHLVGMSNGLAVGILIG